VSHSTDVGCISEGDGSEETTFSRNYRIADSNIGARPSYNHARNIRDGTALVQLVNRQNMLALARQWKPILRSRMHWPQRHAIGLHRRTQRSSIIMKKTLLTGIAALFLATSAQAQEAEECGWNGCSELGDEYICGKSEIDSLFVNYYHVASDVAALTITIQYPRGVARRGKRYPIVRYDQQTDKLTLNVKTCRKAKK